MRWPLRRIIFVCAYRVCLHVCEPGGWEGRGGGSKLQNAGNILFWQPQLHDVNVVCLFGVTHQAFANTSYTTNVLSAYVTARASPTNVAVVQGEDEWGRDRESAVVVLDLGCPRTVLLPQEYRSALETLTVILTPTLSGYFHLHAHPDTLCLILSPSPHPWPLHPWANRWYQNKVQS